MPCFDVVSELDWQELSNAIMQALKEAEQRFDFKGVKSEITVEKKTKILTLWCSEPEKLESLKDVFFSKAIKRGISTLAFIEKDAHDAFGNSKRQVLEIQSGISKDKAKTLIQKIKESKLKVQAQIQEEQVRVTSKSKDELQDAIAFLKEHQSSLGIPMHFTNFRD